MWSAGGRGPDRVRRREHPTDDLFSAAVAFRVDEPLVDEVSDGTGEVALLWSSFIASSEIVSPRSTVERTSSSIRQSTV